MEVNNLQVADGILSADLNGQRCTFTIYGAEPAKTMEPFALVAMQLAIAAGENIIVDGPISAAFVKRANRILLPVLSRYFDQPLHTALIAKDQIVVPAGNGVMTGFSGGIDSLATYAEYRDELTHLCFFDVGSHGVQGDIEGSFQARLGNVREFGDEVGLPVIVVRSDLGRFFTGTYAWTHTIRSAAAALVARNVAGRFLYSSGFPFSETRIGPSDFMAHIDPVILPAIATEGFTAESAGTRYSRIEKTAIVADIPQAGAFLDVCTRPHLAPEGMRNCGICWKCVRTIKTLDVLGYLPRFENSFPLKRYREIVANIYDIEVMASRSALSVEIREAMVANRYDPTLRAKAIAAITPSPIADRISKSFTRLHRSPVLRLLNKAIGQGEKRQTLAPSPATVRLPPVP
jgi:hypothetical protein